MTITINAIGITITGNAIISIINHLHHYHQTGVLRSCHSKGYPSLAKVNDVICLWSSWYWGWLLIWIDIEMKNFLVYSHHDYLKDTLWANAIKAVPKFDESESGVMVLKEVKWTYLMYIYRKQCEVIQKIQWQGSNDKQPTSVFKEGYVNAKNLIYIMISFLLPS